MEDINVPKPEPLNKMEREALDTIGDRIEKAVLENDDETAAYLRKQLKDAARVGIIPVEDAIDASLPPTKEKARKR